MATRTTYWKVVGQRELDDGTTDHLLKQVLNAAGDPHPSPDAAARVYNLPTANEKPRGTIAKLVETRTDTWSVVTP